jgi:signal transduction histidine kinase
MTPDAANPETAPGTPWMDRKIQAEQACSDLAQSPASAPLAKQVREYAADPKWEVRKVVAESLAFLPEAIYRELITDLHRDSNAFVRSAAERSLEKRTPVSNLAEANPGKIQQAYEKIVSKHGPEAAEDAVDFANKITEQHLRTAVHDIKNILPNFNLDLDDLRRAVPSQKRKLDRYEQGCAYLRHLVEMMTKYSEPLTITVAPEPLAEIIREARASAVAQIEEGGRTVTGVKLTAKIPESVNLQVSRFYIVMALTNLIKNGIEAHAISPTEMNTGFVAVEAQIRGGDVVVTVSDGGRGIAPVDLAKLREFIPGGSAKRRRMSGTGYGLPICRRYVEAHGGSLTIQSKEGDGTQVTVRLPLNTNHNSQP